MSLTVKDLYDKTNEFTKSTIEISAFVKQNRFNGKIGFLSITDGTTFKPIQVVYKSEKISNIDEIAAARTWSAIKVIAQVVLTPNAQQPFELQANQIILLKQNDESYPLQNKKQTLEFMREQSHLRPRTNLFSAVMRVRSFLAHALHEFFYKKNFIWVATPLMTSNDGEGAGETFFLSTGEKEEFFGRKVNLTVTGQLHGEAYAQAFRQIYTFGPTFRAEKSHTARHAAEFWMVEPEMAFTNLDDLMALEEEMLKYVAKEYLENCLDEINFLNSEINNELKDRINNIANKKFVKMSYSDGIKELQKAVANGIQFEEKNIYFGMDLGSEHERYLCETIANGPLFLHNYPKEIKAFYMKQNDDKITVDAVDLLVPGIGELVGGSVREDDYDKLLNRCHELKMNIADLEWYLDLRKYGYYSSSGFGLGFERLVMYFTGINNIRDVIPFPRTHGAILF